MKNQKHIVDQILHALNEDITNPAGVLSDTALASNDVITATDVEGCTYVIKISAANKPSSVSAEVLS